MKKFIHIFFLFFNNCTADWAEKTLSQLTLDEKLGQLFIAGVDNSSRNITSTSDKTSEVQDQIINVKENKTTNIQIKDLIKKYKIGGVHFTGFGTIEKCFKEINYLQKLSKIPLLITQDFEWGLSMRLIDAIKFPRNLTLGAIQNNELIYELGKEIGRQCKLLGVHINFAPVIDINSNELNPIIGDRSFGQDKENVTQKAIYFMRGLHDAGIIACAKHFCGHGDTNIDSHLELPVINRTIEELNEIELYPFKKLIEANIKAIMTAHINVPAIDARKNRPITLSWWGIKNLLQNKLNFSGLTITDSLHMKSITKYFKPGEIEIEAFNAGNDLLLMSQDIPKAINALKNAIKKGKISEKEIDRRVLKILRLKEFLKLNKKNINNFSQQEFNTENSKNLKRKLYEAAITIYKNEQNLIPVIQKNISLISDNKTFYQELIKFLPNIDFYSFNDLTRLNDIYNSEIIIVELSNLNKDDHTNFRINEEILGFINKLNKSNKKIMLIIFGTPYALKFFKAFKNIIVSYENDPDAYLATAKIISGNLKSFGKLPITI